MAMRKSNGERLARSSIADPGSLNIPLLNRLRAAEGDYIPTDELGADFEQIQSDLFGLVTFGFEVEQHPYRGAAYRGPAARLCPDQIEHDLATRRIGRRIAVWNRVTSTNDLAARAGASFSNDGLVILAEEQTAGRGRRGRTWTAPACTSILMSVVLFPAPANSEAAFGCAWLTALAAVAVAEVVSEWTGCNARIKWPNDVRIKGRKIAGILVERLVATGWSEPRSGLASSFHSRWGAVIGIGVNVNLDCDLFPAELASCATSMQIEAGGASFDRSEVARDLIKRLDYWYGATQSQGIEVLNAPWQGRSEHLGQTVKVATAAGTLSGRLIALDLRNGLKLAISPALPAEGFGGNASDETRLPIADILSLEGVPVDTGCAITSKQRSSGPV